jgi:putative membrane protein
VRWLTAFLTLVLAIAVTAALIPGIDVDGGIGTYLQLAVLLAAVNLVLGTILRLLALPLRMITLGLFSFVINAALLIVTDWLFDDLHVDGFWTALGAAVLFAILRVVIGSIIDRAPSGSPSPATR